MKQIEPLFDVPNLDCLSVSPDDLAEASRVLGLLSYYAKWTGRAMRARAAGRLQTAFACEAKCQEAYRRLPEAYRW